MIKFIRRKNKNIDKKGGQQKHPTNKVPPTFNETCSQTNLK